MDICDTTLGVCYDTAISVKSISPHGTFQITLYRKKKQNLKWRILVLNTRNAQKWTCTKLKKRDLLNLSNRF